MKRYPSGHRGLLPLETLDFLVQYSRSVAEIDLLHAAGVPFDPFAQFVLDQMSREDFLTLWRQHEALIVAECRRRGMAVPDPTTYRRQEWVNYGR